MNNRHSDGLEIVAYYEISIIYYIKTKITKKETMAKPPNLGTLIAVAKRLIRYLQPAVKQVDDIPFIPPHFKPMPPSSLPRIPNATSPSTPPQHGYGVEYLEWDILSPHWKPPEIVK
jgi:hypothetical protein